MSVEFAPYHNQERRAQNQVYTDGARAAVPRGVMLEKVKTMNAETTDQARPAEGVRPSGSNHCVPFTLSHPQTFNLWPLPLPSRSLSRIRKCFASGRPRTTYNFRQTLTAFGGVSQLSSTGYELTTHSPPGRDDAQLGRHK